MEYTLRFFVFISLVAVCFSQVISFTGKCPKVYVQKDFSIEKYIGKWYEMERFFASFEAFHDCVTANYTLQPGGVVKVNNTGYSHKFWDKGYTTAIGDAVAEDPNNPAKLGVRFSPRQPRGDYWVLSTDYNTYTVIWSCTDLPIPFLKANLQFAWILTRRPGGISTQKKERLYRLMEGYGINTSKFSATNQENCPGR
ncbi:apolipoprotein D-like [Ruditapes philippinarum]|uniref:apolipoprotein D-like n=1 Tax=Ruditapes philippinarum TaxID=129788 RepID=UPI00295C0C8E|nr:apolipoprotein D-like [Ruditapes philippinarum]